MALNSMVLLPQANARNRSNSRPQRPERQRLTVWRATLTMTQPQSALRTCLARPSTGIKCPAPHCAAGSTMAQLKVLDEKDGTRAWLLRLTWLETKYNRSVRSGQVTTRPENVLTCSTRSPRSRQCQRTRRNRARSRFDRC